MNKQFIANFFKGSVSASLGTFSTILFHFLSIMVMTRYMPKESFGIYLLILVIVQGLKLLGGLGLDLTVVKFIAREKETDDREAFTTVVLLRTVQLTLLSGIFYLVGHLILPFLDERLNQYLFSIGVIFWLASFRELFFHVLQGLHYFKRYAMAQVASAVAKFGMILLFLYFQQLTVQNLLTVEIITYALSILHLLTLLPLRSLVTAAIPREMVLRVLKFGVPLYFNNLLTFIHGKVSDILIATFLGPVSLAYFGVAGKIPEGFGRLFKSFIVVYFPNLSRLFSRGQRDDARRMMNKSLVLFSSVLVFLALLSFLFRHEVVRWIFSEKYLEASLAFSLLMLNFYLRSMSNLLGYSLVSAGYSAVPAKVNTVSSALNLAGGLVLIPQFGFIGAVYSLLFMNVVSMILYYRYLLRAHLGVEFRQFVKPLALFGLSAGLYGILGEAGLGIKLLLSLAYLAGCWLMLSDIRSVLGLAGRWVGAGLWNAFGVGR